MNKILVVSFVALITGCGTINQSPQIPNSTIVIDDSLADVEVSKQVGHSLQALLSESSKRLHEAYGDDFAATFTICSTEFRDEGKLSVTDCSVINN